MPFPTKFFTEADKVGNLYTVLEVGPNAEVMVQNQTGSWAMNNLIFEARGSGEMYGSSSQFVVKTHNSYADGSWSDFVTNRQFSSNIIMPYTTVTEYLFSVNSQFRCNKIWFTNPLTFVGVNAFFDLRATQVPGGLDVTFDHATVKYQAFRNVEKLIVEPGSTVDVIENNSFQNSGLTEIDVGTNHVGASAFEDCQKLVKFNTDNKIVQGMLDGQSSSAFKNCYSLNYIEWDNYITSQNGMNRSWFVCTDHTVNTTVKTSNTYVRNFDWLKYYNRQVTFIGGVPFLGIRHGNEILLYEGNTVQASQYDIVVKDSNNTLRYIPGEAVQANQLQSGEVYIKRGSNFIHLIKM